MPHCLPAAAPYLRALPSSTPALPFCHLPLRFLPGRILHTYYTTACNISAALARLQPFVYLYHRPPPAITPPTTTGYYTRYTPLHTTLYHTTFSAHCPTTYTHYTVTCTPYTLHCAVPTPARYLPHHRLLTTTAPHHTPACVPLPPHYHYHYPHTTPCLPTAPTTHHPLPPPATCRTDRRRLDVVVVGSWWTVRWDGSLGGDGWLVLVACWTCFGVGVAVVCLVLRRLVGERDKRGGSIMNVGMGRTDGRLVGLSSHSISPLFSHLSIS